MDQPISKVDLPATQRDLIEQALVHFDAKEFGQARTVSDKLLQLAPQDYSALHLAGVVATAQNRLPEASEFLKRALKRAPDAIKASVSWFALGKALQGAHDLRQAQEAFRRAIRLNPGVCSYYIELADVYADEWKLDLAIETLKTAINRFPTDAVPCAALGNVLHQYGRQSDALIAYELAVKRQPDYADARLSIGSMLKALGRFKEAEAETLEALQFDPMCRAYSQLAQFRKFGPDAPEIDKIKKRLDPEANAPDAARVDALYALSKIYDDLGDYPTAFRYLEDACNLNRSTIEFSIAEEEERIENIIALFTPDFFARYSGKGVSDLAPIFIMGMPRSGTTLTEQILASHSEVRGGGELPFITQISKQLGQAWESRDNHPLGDEALVVNDLILAAAYYKEMTANLWRTNSRFTDKMPSNFFYVGVIQILFPKANIIYCRRNPVATCLSCLQTYFSPDNVLFSYDLTEVGRFYKLHKRIMEYWQKTLPGRILEVEYENLVEYPEVGIRRILDFCELEFEAACLDFHALKRPVVTASFMQVRRPIYKSSVDHWKHYAPFLGPLFDALEMKPPAGALP